MWPVWPTASVDVVGVSTPQDSVCTRPGVGGAGLTAPMGALLDHFDGVRGLRGMGVRVAGLESGNSSHSTTRVPGAPRGMVAKIPVGDRTRPRPGSGSSAGRGHAARQHLTERIGRAGRTG